MSAGDIQQRVLSQVKPGSICLFHNAAKHTPEALPGIIEKLQADGYKLVPISENIIKQDYTIDHEGKQHAKGENASSAASSKTVPTNAAGVDEEDAAFQDYAVWEDMQKALTAEPDDVQTGVPQAGDGKATSKAPASKGSKAKVSEPPQK